MLKLSQVNIPKASLESILDLLPYPFLLTQFIDNTFKHIYFNQPFLNEIGYTLSEIPSIHEWFLKAYPESDYRYQVQKNWNELLAQAKANGKTSISTHARIRTKNNGVKWFEVKSSLTADGYQFVSFINIDEVLTKDEQLKRANENKNKMLSILSHDLRSAMINLYSLTNLATIHGLSPVEFMALAVQVKERSAQALELLDTTVHWTKANFENIKLASQPAPLRKIVNHILEVDRTYQEKNIQLTITIDPKLKPVTDQGIITIVIRNLISNAVKFTPDNGSVDIQASGNTQNFSLTVRDSGRGMDAKLVEAILSDQYSPSIGTMREKGSGVGLTLCRDLLKKINGRLEIRSEPGKGTEMRVEVQP